MDNKTFVSIEFWQLVGFLLSFLGVCWGFGKMLLSQFQAQQDERQKHQDKLAEKVESLENQFAEQKAVLPQSGDFGSQNGQHPKDFDRPL